MSVEGTPSKIWFGLHLSPALPSVGETGGVRGHLRGARQVLRPATRHKMGLGFARQRHGEGAKRGDHTGPSPTDRAKSGVKRHVLTDARGVPLSVLLTGANVHDKWMVADALDAVVIRERGRPKRPAHLCLDKGYDYRDAEHAVRKRGIVPHIRRRGEQPLLGCVRGRPRRWVVERTNAWHNRFRGLLVRWERKSENYLALVQLACGLIAFQQAT